MAETLQSIYNRLGCRGAAEHLGMSTATISSHLKANGVIVRKRGGDWKRMPSQQRPGKIEANRIANHAAGDPSFRALHVTRHHCAEAGRQCVFTASDGNCPTCRAEHSLDSICSGASSSWNLAMIGAGR